MFKRGFTLQELLITIGVIGIVAAICAPAVVNIVPDKTKTIYMKAYTTLSNLTNEILNDSTLYYTTYDASGNPNCEGMRCSDNPFGAFYNSQDYYVGATKYPAILASKMNLIEDEPNYDNTSPTAAMVWFTTIDGVYWNFKVDTKSDIDGIMDYLAEANHDILVGFNEENRLKVQETQGKPFHIEQLIALLRRKI